MKVDNQLISSLNHNNMAPEYLCELVFMRKSSPKLRSSSQWLCLSSSDCGFSIEAPTFRNRLLANIRNVSSLENLKSLLKTNLFKIAFTDKYYLWY